MTDLFGETPAHYAKNAYPAMPGTGPSGKRCRDCGNFRRVRLGNTYFKCALVNWTGGAGTDVKATAPACERYVEKEEVK